MYRKSSPAPKVVHPHWNQPESPKSFGQLLRERLAEPDTEETRQRREARLDELAQLVRARLGARGVQV